MLLKCLGSGLILLSAIGRIFSKELEFAAHRQQLQQFALLLTVLKNEICLLRLPLPLALEHCAGQMQAPFSDLCRQMADALCEQSGTDAAELWNGLAAQMDALVFGSDERALFAETGELLRMDNVAFKEERFAVFLQRLETLRATYETSLSERRRMNRYGTALAGIFVILLLL